MGAISNLARARVTLNYVVEVDEEVSILSKKGGKTEETSINVSSILDN